MSDADKKKTTPTADAVKAAKEKAAAAKAAPAPKPAPKAKPAAPAKAEPEAAAAPTVHGVEINAGDSKKGGTDKKPLMTLVPYDAIVIEKGFNPRIHIDEEKVKDLAKIIKTDGLLHPPVVRPVVGKEGRFSIVCGERRYRALGLLEWKEIPVTVRSDLAEDNARAKAIAIAENVEENRENLNPVELGRSFAALRDEHNWTPAKIASETGVNHQRVRRCLEIMDAPKDVQAQVATGDLSLGAALEYTALDDEQRKALKDSLKPGVSAAEIKKAAKEHARAKEKEGKGEVTGDGKSATRKKGTERSKALAAWRGNREKQEMIGRACHALAAAKAEGKFDTDYHNIAGSVAALLWSRGDLEGIFPPAETDKAEFKSFWNKVNEESEKFAAAHAQPAEGENVGEGEGKESAAE